MLTFPEMSAISSFRTRLMTFQRATAFARCLENNARFTAVSVIPSPRAKSMTVRYYVSYMPSSQDRQQAILDRERGQREQRAASRSYTFTWDASLGAYRCPSSTGRGSYEVTVSSCSCGDWTNRGRHHSLPCVHQCALLSQLETGAVCEDAPAPVETQRQADNRRFDELFSDSYQDWLK